MADNPIAPNPLVEKAIQDYPANNAAFKADVADIIKADLGSPQKLAQDAQQIEQQLKMTPADLVKLGFPSTILSDDAGSPAQTASSDSSAAKTAQVKYDAQNRPSEVDYPNGMVAKITRDQTGQITEADITGSPDKTYNGTFKLQGDGLLHEFDANGKESSVTVKPSDVEISPDGAVQVIAKEKVAFFNVSGYIDVNTQGVATQHAGSPPQGTPA